MDEMDCGVPRMMTVLFFTVFGVLFFGSAGLLAWMLVDDFRGDERG